MGAPILEPKEIPVAVEESPVVNVPVEGKRKNLSYDLCIYGKPACHYFYEQCKRFGNCSNCPYFENHTVFPKRTNTEFVEVLDRNTVNMRVWERGSDETLACGTGACATTVACILNDKTENEVTVHLLGGDLKIRWDREANQVI